MDYRNVLDSYGAIIEEDLKILLDEMVKEGQEYHPFLRDVYDATREFVQRGGRRLSACSTLIIYQGFTGKIDDRIVRVCSCIELYRHSILIHDDIVDAEDKRRGGSTLHKTIARGFDERFGVGSAMFAGNILYALAIERLMQSGFEQNKLVDAARLLAEEFRAVNESQVLDMLFEYRDPDVKEWEIMAGRRAASLFKASMLVGAMLASASEKDLVLIVGAARHIGFAFDIQDDIIDTFATEEQYGRVPCGDIGKRKKPLHVILALQKEKRLAAIMREERSLEDSEIKYVQSLIRDCGALDEAKSISREHAGRAEKMVSQTGMNQDAKDFFISFIRFVEESLEWYK
ncbi:MAG: polyprenyl synthetase family protein [Methanothrix sp.]|jgi:geranylgeranyl diphosphate synthase type I|nr:polyprenyl synthetase family protein [Methanothrix sp.]